MTPDEASRGYPAVQRRRSPLDPPLDLQSRVLPGASAMASASSPAATMVRMPHVPAGRRRPAGHDSGTRSPSSISSTAATCSACSASSATRPSTWSAATSISTRVMSSGSTPRPHRSTGSPIGPRVTLLLPWRVADRLKAIAWWERTSFENLIRRGAEELVARSGGPCLPRDARGGLPSAAGRADGIWSIGALASREMGSWSSTDPVTRTNPHRRRPRLGWGGERVPLVAFGAGSSAEGGAMSRVAEPRRVTL